MRKDIKIGMLAGTVLCIAGIILFCTREEVIQQPLVKIQPQNQTPAAKNKDYIHTEPVEHSPAVEVGRIHIVAQGQTLSDISKIYYGNFIGWKRIYEANKEQFPKGPNTIKPGTKLIIPQ